MNIHILQLQKNKLFVHASASTDKTQVFREYCLLYEYAQKYPPITIVDTIFIETIDFSQNTLIRNMFIYEINKYVKQYMFCYSILCNGKGTILDGINNVRGGSYTDEILPNYIVKALEYELNTVFIDDELYHSFFTNQSFIREKREIYLEKKKQYDYFTKTPIHMYMNYIEWIYTTCTTTRQEIDTENKEKYKKTISFIKQLYSLYQTILKENDEKEVDSPYLISMKYPEFTFDDYFYHDKKTQLFIDIDGKLWNTFELLYYTVYNKIEELKYDLSCFPPYMEQLIRVSYLHSEEVLSHTPDIENEE
jgi:hypothetical protein